MFPPLPSFSTVSPTHPLHSPGLHQPQVSASGSTIFLEPTVSPSKLCSDLCSPLLFPGPFEEENIKPSTSTFLLLRWGRGSGAG